MTDLIPDHNNPSAFSFDHESLKALLNGNFRSHKCMNCDGTGWEHAGDGEIIGTGFKVDIENLITPYICEDCNGFGQIVLLNSGSLDNEA